MLAILALVLIAIVALTVLGFAVHVLFSPWLLLAVIGILAWSSSVRDAPASSLLPARAHRSPATSGPPLATFYMTSPPVQDALQGRLRARRQQAGIHNGACPSPGERE